MTKTNTQLVPTFGIKPQIVLPADYFVDNTSIEQRDTLVVRAKGLKPITDAATMEVAVGVGVEIRRACKTCKGWRIDSRRN